MAKENKKVSAVYLANLGKDFLDSYSASELDYDILDSPAHADYHYYYNQLEDTLIQVNEYGVDIDL